MREKSGQRRPNREMTPADGENYKPHRSESKEILSLEIARLNGKPLSLYNRFG